MSSVFRVPYTYTVWVRDMSNPAGSWVPKVYLERPSSRSSQVPPRSLDAWFSVTPVIGLVWSLVVYAVYCRASPSYQANTKLMLMVPGVSRPARSSGRPMSST
jgi:hypothetical protein